MEQHHDIGKLRRKLPRSSGLRTGMRRRIVGPCPGEIIDYKQNKINVRVNFYRCMTDFKVSV